MKKRVRQGHTRWRVLVEYHKVTGRPAVAWVVPCFAEKVSRDRIVYSVGGYTRSISHTGWMRMRSTYRQAMRDVEEIIGQANREIRREYGEAWVSA